MDNRKNEYKIKQENKWRHELHISVLILFLFHVKLSFIPKVNLVRIDLEVFGIRINIPRGECAAAKNTLYSLYSISYLTVSLGLEQPF